MVNASSPATNGNSTGSPANRSTVPPPKSFPGIDRLTSDDCLKIYAGLTVALLLLSLVRSLIFRHMLTRSSFTLHSRMFRAVIRTPVIFFDRNPIGKWQRGSLWLDLVGLVKEDAGVVPGHFDYKTKECFF